MYPETSDRTLEDLDAYYRANPPLIVTRDKDSISVKRPQKFVEMEEEDMKKATHERESPVLAEHKQEL